jgi:hypothetical protein
MASAPPLAPTWLCFIRTLTAAKLVAVMMAGRK